MCRHAGTEISSHVQHYNTSKCSISETHASVTYVPCKFLYWLFNLHYDLMAAVV